MPLTSFWVCAIVIKISGKKEVTINVDVDPGL